MITDTSFTARLRCENCRRRTEHYGLLSPEGETIFLRCVSCGSLTTASNNLQAQNRQRQLTTPRFAVAVAGIAILALASVALFRKSSLPASTSLSVQPRRRISMLGRSRSSAKLRQQQQQQHGKVERVRNSSRGLAPSPLSSSSASVPYR